jgi:hypothetical protein
MQHNRFFPRAGGRLERSMGFHEFTLLEYYLGERVAQLTEAALEIPLEVRMDPEPIHWDRVPFLPIPARDGGVVP